jgi:poly(A) polymerase
MAGRAEIARARDIATEPRASALLAALESGGEQARIVGGAVRNALLDLPISDVDIATTRLPPDVIEVARDKGWKSVPTGIEHGTVTVIIDGRPFEVTTLREDIATDGRHAVVRFGRNFEQDAARRDFTINALSVGRDGVVHDYFGGLDDLAARRVRFIGDPDQRLREDYLRGLRFLRFSAEYAHGPLDGAGLAAVDRQKHGFSGLSAERIRQEMLKLLVAKRAVDVVAQAEERGLISLLLAGEANLGRFQSVATRDSVRNAILRLYALGVHAAGDVEGLRGTLRLSNAECAMLASFLEGERLLAGGATTRHLGYAVPDALAGLAVLTPEAFGASSAEIERHLTALAAEPPHLALSGADLIKRGLAPGPRMGKVLAEAERLWIAAGLPNGKEDQDRLLEAAILTVGETGPG